MNEIQKAIQDALGRQRGIRRKRAWLAFFGTLALAMTLAAVLDRMVMFSGLARWSGWLVGLAIAALVAHRVAGSDSTDASTLAHRIEEDAEETAPVVATAIDPAVRRTAEGEPLGEALLKRVDERAAEAIRTAPPTFEGRLRAPATLAAVAAAALVALLAIHGGQGLLRMLAPWSASPYTSLTLQGPEGDLPEGGAFTLTAQVSGVPVGKVFLHVVGTTEPLAEAAPDESGMVQLELDGLDAPAEFVIRGGDGQSDPLHIHPYSLPLIEAFEIAVSPPHYAADAADLETDPSFTAFRGSQLRYRLRLKAPAVSVAFERSVDIDEEERATAEELADFRQGIIKVPAGSENAGGAPPRGPTFRQDPDDPLVWEADWNLPDPEDIVYRLAVTGKRGDLVRNDEPWRINVLSDAAPKVRIRSHDGGDVIKTGVETVRFNLSAVDDVRLAKAHLVFRKPGQPHTRREIELPTNTLRTWSGAELLDLMPFDLRPYDIVAVHAEADDANLIDGAGIGRSEVIFLEVPLLGSDDGAGGEGGEGGEGGSGTPPINPLVLQMEILKSTMALPDDAPAEERDSLAHDQRQNAEYTGMIGQAAAAAGTVELGEALGKAKTAMESAAGLLDSAPASKAIPDEEAALGFLVDAAKLLEESSDQFPKGDDAEIAAEGMRFQLRPQQSQSATSQNTKEDVELEREKMRELMEEVRRQVAEQKKLDQEAGEPGERAGEQEALAGDARAAAELARSMAASATRRGDPQATAEELERAAGLQDDTADALAGGDLEAGALAAATMLAPALQSSGGNLSAALNFASPVGIIGLLVMVWGLFGSGDDTRR